MLLRFLFVTHLFLPVHLTSLREERLQTIERVRNYLQQFDIGPPSQAPNNWLPNSNKIGVGYNLLAGSPVCYTGACQMTEFNPPIFKLNYTTAVPGSCSNKLVPDNVHLDCLPSTSLKIDSEIMDTVEHVHTSISDKVKVSLEAKYKGVAFSYSFSRETRKMLDNIVKNHQTSIYTTAEISYVKLLMFESLMQLSDYFRYVIENMPCCEEDDSDIAKYVKDFIFDLFGFTYVSTILLGGVAQQTIFINREAKERLESNEINIVHEAKVSFGKAFGFGVEAGTTVNNSQTNSNYNSFKQEVRSEHTDTLGGTTHLTTLVEWSKTVEDNPVITKFEIRDIFRILTSHYFPNDPFITNKSKLIEKILEQYLAGSVYCYNNCGGNGTRGTCEPTGYFKFGICKCKPGWTGADCETIEPPKILHGTICGFDRSIMRINCHGVRPWEACPKSWAQHNWRTDLTICYKNQTEIGTPVYGTLCGLHSYQQRPYPFEHDIGCSTTDNLNTGTCPLGYQRYIASTPFPPRPPFSGNSVKRNAVCTVMDATEHLPGTLCGMQIQHTIDGPSCDGFHPGLSKCPTEYALKYTAFDDTGFMVCVKK